MSKKDERQRISERLKQMEKTEYLERSANLANRLFNTRAWQEADRIGLTYSHFPEVDTLSIITHALTIGKRVALPRTTMHDRTMAFYTIEGFNDLERRSYGLYEPKMDACSYVAPDELDLLLVPGVAFTTNGYRLGMGGGFYDRYLPKVKGATISLCFKEQLVQSLSIESHDFPVNVVISEEIL
ncbi:5-formyltetrahydrofolate cyclo-ligase [Bacillus sp. Marseille-P3800]|uniref:5-formyltetrahydrofolate cyclo-ligase n=1 Tax=Bacillus sp. Marseille-P3800 TaxID=2014782 RepID=UPI000C06E0D1|nr:5-formyltetrahydrofolate cyclo-ligase [Bacillus sp. Marseille-P3800]